MAWTFYDASGNALQLTGNHALSSHTGTVDSAEIAAGAIDLAHMSIESVDSDQYVDGSIDLVHMSVNSINSDQYVDGSIDNIHLATGIDAIKLADGSVTNAELQYINSLSSNAQTQIGLKAPIASPTFTTGATSPSFITGNSGTIKLVDGDGTHYSTIAAHATTTASVPYTWPPAGPSTSGYALTSTTGGVMSWAAAGGASLSGSTDNTIVTVTGADAMIGEANLTFDGTGALTVTNPAASSSTNIMAYSSMTSGTGSPARLILRTAAGNTADTFISFHGVGTYERSIGVDNSDSDKFKISGSALGTNDILVIQSHAGAAGRIIINPTSALNPQEAGSPFAIKADTSHRAMEWYTSGSDTDSGYRFHVYERGSGGGSGDHSYVGQTAVPIMSPGSAGSRGGIAFVHGENEGDTTTFTDMVVVPVTGNFSNSNYSGGSGNVIFRLNVRGSPPARTYSLGATNTLYLAMASGNYNVVVMNMGLSGLAT